MAHDARNWGCWQSFKDFLNLISAAFDLRLGEHVEVYSIRASHLSEDGMEVAKTRFTANKCSGSDLVEYIGDITRTSSSSMGVTEETLLQMVSDYLKARKDGKDE